MPVNRLTHSLARVAGAAVDFVFPRICPGCDERVSGRAGLVCLDCLKSMEPLRDPLCPVCGAPDTAVGSVACANCPPHPRHFTRARAATSFRNVARTLVERVKYAERTEYVPVMGELMAAVFEREFLRVPPDLLVPVPLHRVRQRERGFNQAERLARHLSLLFKVPLAPRGAVVRVRATPSQTRLGREERAENIRGAFEVRIPELFAGRSLLLVDDVFTTGATLNEVAGALTPCGPDDINCIAFARTLLAD